MSRDRVGGARVEGFALLSCSFQGFEYSWAHILLLLSDSDSGQDLFPSNCNVMKINTIPTLIKCFVSPTLNYFCVFYVKLQLNILE